MKRAAASLDQIGSVGALVAAIAAPCCFPLFTVVSLALGLGALGRYESAVLYLFQGFAVLSLIGLATAFMQHRNPAPLLLGAASASALAYNFYGSFSLVALYGGLLGVLAALFFYDCRACGALLKPAAGDCCVFCSSGSIPCPPIQMGQGCCTAARAV